MHSLIKGLVVSLSLVVSANALGDSLQGKWEMNTAKSSAANKPKAETMIVDVSNGVERGSYDVTAADGTKRLIEYEAAIIEEKQWTPQKDGGAALIVKLDELTSVRFSRRADGRPSMALRTVSKEGRTFVWNTIDTDGKTTGTYLFEKQ